MKNSIRKGSEVSHSIYGGLWKIVTREASMSVFKDCVRYTLQNVKTGKIVISVRDKDVITKNNSLFNQFVQIGDNYV